MVINQTLTLLSKTMSGLIKPMQSNINKTILVL